MVAVITLVGVLVFLLTNSSTGESATSTVPVSSSITPTPNALTQAEADELKAAINSSDKAKQAEVLSTELRSGEWSAAAVGTIDEIKVDTFQLTGSYGRVNAKMGAKTVIVHLVRQDGKWRIKTTEEVSR